MLKKILPTVYFGLLLLLLGAGFLVDNLGLIDIGDVLADWWPTYVFVAGGLIYYLTKLTVNSLIFGGTLMLVGAIWQLSNLGIIKADVGGLIWPFFIVGLGILILYNSVVKPRTIEGLELAGTTVFGDNREDYAGKEYKGSTSTCVLGELEIDLRKANFTGDNIVVDTTSILGETNVRVPDNAKIINKVNVVLVSVTQKMQSGDGIEIVYSVSVILGKLVIQD